MNLYRFSLAALFFSLVFSCMAQLPNDSIIADFHHFIEYLEETHPDPYTEWGMWYNAEKEDLNDKIPTGNLSFAFIGKEQETIESLKLIKS